MIHLLSGVCATTAATYLKHLKKKVKVATEEAEEEEEVLLAPCELHYGQVEIDEEVRRVVRSNG